MDDYDQLNKNTRRRDRACLLGLCSTGLAVALVPASLACICLGYTSEAFVAASLSAVSAGSAIAFFKSADRYALRISAATMNRRFPCN